MESPTALVIDDKYWKVVFNATPIPTILLKADEPYTVVFANEAYLKLTSLTREEVIGESFITIAQAHSPDVGGTLQSIRQVSADKLAQKQSKIRYVYKTSQIDITKYLDIYNTPVLGDDGEITFIIRTINDVTELEESHQREKAIHEDLVKHEKFLRETQRVANIGNWDVDMVNNTVVWSDTLKEIFEVPADYEPTFETGLAFYKDDASRSALINAVNEAVNSDSVFDIELEIVTAAGNIRWVRCTGKADVADGTCVRLYGITQDITASKTTGNALKESISQYEALIESVEGVMWEADANTFEFTYISNKIRDILGYTPEQWLSDPHFWAKHIYQDDREWAVSFCQHKTRELANHVFDYRMIKADGGIVWIKDLVSVISESGKPTLLRGVMIDVSMSKLLSNLDHLEKNVLEMVTDKAEDIYHILDFYLKGIENLLPNMKCSLLKVKNNRLYTMAAPSLPQEYLDIIDDQPIDKNAGSCGMSALLKEIVIVADISSHPLWTDYKQLALKHNLRSCWSYPIINSNNKVIAVLGMYYDDIKQSGDAEKLVIERSAAILKVIIENWQRARIIEENTLLIAQGQELANFGNWQWDIRNNTVKWSDVLYDIYGVDKKNHVATFEGYLALLHPDDREPVKNIINSALQTQQDIVFEERIIRPNGEMRNLRSWGRVLLDEHGKPEKMIGSCLDITAAKNTESQLWDIAWMQSHLFRAPLVRLMGLVNLLKEEHQGNGAENQLFDYIMSTAHELDKVVKDISNKTINN